MEAQAIVEAMSNAMSDAQALLDSGKDIKAKRDKKPTKESKKVVPVNKSFEELIRENGYMPSADLLGRMPSYEEFCQAELLKAEELGYPEPYFDYRNDYFIGQTLYYVFLNDYTGDKEIYTLKVRNIYPRMLILTEDKGLCHCVGYNQRDYVFDRLSEAEVCYDNAIVGAKYLKEEHDDEMVLEDTEQEENIPDEE